MIRPVPFLFIAIASLLIGCDTATACQDCGPSGHDLDGDGLCDADCIEDSGEDSSSEVGFLNVTAMILGTEVPTNVIVDGKVVGKTNEDIELPPGDYTIAVGDDPKVTSTDGIPIVQIEEWAKDPTWSDSSWIAPPMAGTVTALESAKVIEPENTVPMNMWRPAEYWTCDEVRSWNGSELPGTPAMTAYLNGNSFHMPGVGAMVVDGISLSIAEHTTGEFTSPITATIVAVQDEAGEYYITSTCYKSDEDGNKVDADGNPVLE